MIDHTVYIVNFYCAGNLRAGSSVFLWEAMEQCSLNSILATVETAPVGLDLTFSVEIYNSDANTKSDLDFGDSLPLTISASEKRGQVLGIGKLLNVNDKVIVSITQIGSIVKGADLTLTLHLQKV
jgi:glutaredoxin-related protein